MEFIQLPNFLQSADAATDRFDQVIRDIRADIPGTIETVALNTIWGVTWAVTFAAAFTFYAGQAAAEAWRTRNYAAITAEICLAPDADLNELVLPILSMVATDIDVVELGAETDDLATLSAHQLRPLCQSRGIQWRNVRGHGKHLAKAEMIAALTC
jgi:hypothetical protein